MSTTTAAGVAELEAPSLFPPEEEPGGGWGVELGEVRQLARELADLSLADLRDRPEQVARVEGAIVALEGVRNRATYEQLGLISTWLLSRTWRLRGHRTAADWLAWRLGIDGRTARARIRVAEALDGLPGIEAAFARGELGYTVVRELTRVATSEDEEDWLELSRRLPTSELLARCRPTPTHQDVVCRLTQRPLRNGLVEIVAHVLPEEAVLVLKALDERARADDLTPNDESRAYALVELANDDLARAEAPAKSPGRYEVQVRVAAEVLRGDAAPGPRPEGTCRLTDGTPLDPQTARRLACDAALVEYADDGQGTPLDVGRRTRTIPPSLHRALHQRDHGRCRWPGCSAARYVDGHHVVHWAHGGATALSNLVLLCHVHHKLVHEGGARVEVLGKSRFTFFDPRGALVPLHGANLAP